MTRSCRLLIIDDTPEDRESYRRMLSRDVCYEILEASTAEDGLKQFHALRPDCVLLDYELPDASGMELLEELMQAMGDQPAALLMITGHGSEQVATSALQNGACDYLSKHSLTPEILQLAVQNALQKLELQRQIEQQQRELARLYQEERQRNTLLERRISERDQLLATLAHELRNPLGAIVAAGQMMQLVQPIDPRLQRVADVLMRQSDHMTRMIDELLDLARVTRGQVELRKKSIDLRTAINDAVICSRELIDSRKHHLELTLPPHPLYLEADPTRVGQVLVNLLKNAAKYTDPGGRIALRAWQEGDQVAISIRDNGQGISKELQASIFEPFTRGDQSRAHRVSGLGLGLSVVQKLVELHQGSILLNSAGAGQGAEFVVRLPIGLGVSADGSADHQATDAAGLRILVVEDMPDVRDMISELLTTLGHEVLIADNGLNGLEQLRQQQPDLAFVDIGLPELDGYQLARQARSWPDGDNLILIALTGYGQAEDRCRALESGFNDHIVKPLDLSKLTRVLAAREQRLHARR